METLGSGSSDAVSVLGVVYSTDSAWPKISTHQPSTNTQIQNIIAKMSRQNLDTEELISHLSYYSILLSRTMIDIRDPPKLMGAWQPRDDPSSLVALAILPVELLHEVLKQLDLRSITRFSRVSIRAMRAIQSFPAYRNLMSHAPHALEALSQTRMIPPS